MDERQSGGFYLTGEYLELEPYSRIVHVERMHLPDPTPDNHVETRFDPDGAGTLMTMRMTLAGCRNEDAHARDRHGARNGSELRSSGKHALGCHVVPKFLTGQLGAEPPP